MGLANIGIPGASILAVTADPGALAAVTAVDVDVTGFNVQTTDRLIPIPNIALEARLCIQAASCPVEGTIRLRFINQSAAAAGGGALAHQVLVLQG